MTTKIEKINIQNFTTFINQEIVFCKGINVIIGSNGKGKTHFLKLLNIFCLAINENKFNKESINNYLLDYFKTSNLDSLISHYSQEKDCYSTVNLRAFNQDYWLESLKNEKLNTSETKSRIEKVSIAYLPPQEMLSTYLKFIPIYEKYETNYEKTYYDLAKLLSNPKLKNLDPELSLISEFISNGIRGKLNKDNNGNFSLEDSKGRKVEASLLGEGIKKLATIQYLIQNDSINKDSILFWDEPEVHLNPVLITTLSEVIKKLANNGVQLFISTHDHLLTQQISLLDEYRDQLKDIPEIRFFVLSEDAETGATKIESGNNLTDLQYNPILEEYLKHHDHERELFYKSIE